MEQLRGVVAPLSAGNQLANAPVESTVSAMDAAEDRFGPVIPPGDTTLPEPAAAMRDAEASATTC